MRRFPTGVVVAILVIVVLVVVARYEPLFGPSGEYGKVVSMRGAPSHIYASLAIHYAKPPIYQEIYEVRDDNGISTYQYIVRSYAGRQITVRAPPRVTYDVSFFFGKLIQDGIFDVPSLPANGDEQVSYTVNARRTEAMHTDTNTANFTNPQFWASTKTHIYHLHLSPKGPLPNIFTLHGGAIRDPRYLQILDDFRAFGPKAFRTAVNKANADALSP
jgi:hypothetical protein